MNDQKFEYFLEYLNKYDSQDSSKLSKIVTNFPIHLGNLIRSHESSYHCVVNISHSDEDTSKNGCILLLSNACQTVNEAFKVAHKSGYISNNFSYFS